MFVLIRFYHPLPLETWGSWFGAAAGLFLQRVWSSNDMHLQVGLPLFLKSLGVTVTHQIRPSFLGSFLPIICSDWGLFINSEENIRKAPATTPGIISTPNEKATSNPVEISAQFSLGIFGGFTIGLPWALNLPWLPEDTSPWAPWAPWPPWAPWAGWLSRCSLAHLWLGDFIHRAIGRHTTGTRKVKKMMEHLQVEESNLAKSQSCVDLIV